MLVCDIFTEKDKLLLIYYAQNPANQFPSELKNCDYRLVYKLASLYPEVVEEKGLIQQVTDIISENLVAAKVAETELTGSYSTNTAKTMFQPCQYDTTNSSECRFVLVLAGIGNAIRYVDYNFLGVKAYIRDRAVAKQDVTLQGLEDYVEEYYGIVIDDKMQFPRYNYHYQVIINLITFTSSVTVGVKMQQQQQ